ncbi:MULTISPECIES: Cof-type HAD-IIB family hydrolase [Peribacillus]|uniref:Cof-type HAD-IIB family hydrolase n=1 Tax=Peribacillus castrilensis TaxID=2897690 RepID=A0AAW9NF19_9BACI|nr:Cof-type HAD-IIB family hydrolase [Peribacillus frigoritolerans]MEC0273720.1 Cof-type HAD-IIB family hydrolase [Peribacillus castrilensis]MEC0297907.1 Cof-type HAD-IIB family hydrolase [Peribacillus castrilensis]MEC0343332.1 Cof-type HAD-IIB family hydrolase [Peribacillus castrilensis]TFH61043.1 HAD family phosphatase [Peribacillus frigoritolerans]
MVYRLLAVNIDGTLLQSNGRLNKSTKEAIDYVHQKGVHVALVTSRNYHSAKKVAKALKINPMIVAQQGAFVGASMEKPIMVKRISEELTAELVQMLEKTTCQILLIHEKYSLGNRVNLPENLLGKSVMYLNDQNIYAQNYVDDISEELIDQPMAPTKMDIIFPEKNARNDMLKLIKEMFPEVDVLLHPGHKLTIVPKGVSKWSGVLYLADHLAVKRTEIVSIGDGLDDMEMIAGSGLGVAMGNADEEVRKVAKWVTRSNDQDGVAYMLREFFRKQHPIEFLQKMNMLK